MEGIETISIGDVYNCTCDVIMPGVSRNILTKGYSYVISEYDENLHLCKLKCLRPSEDKSPYITIDAGILEMNFERV